MYLSDHSDDEKLAPTPPPVLDEDNDITLARIHEFMREIAYDNDQLMLALARFETNGLPMPVDPSSRQAQAVLMLRQFYINESLHHGNMTTIPAFLDLKDQHKAPIFDQTFLMTTHTFEWKSKSFTGTFVDLALTEKLQQLGFALVSRGASRTPPPIVSEKDRKIATAQQHKARLVALEGNQEIKQEAGEQQVEADGEVIHNESLSTMARTSLGRLCLRYQGVLDAFNAEKARFEILAAIELEPGDVEEKIEAEADAKTQDIAQKKRALRDKDLARKDGMRYMLDKISTPQSGYFEKRIYPLTSTGMPMGAEFNLTIPVLLALLWHAAGDVSAIPKHVRNDPVEFARARKQGVLEGLAQARTGNPNYTEGRACPDGAPKFLIKTLSDNHPDVLVNEVAGEDAITSFIESCIFESLISKEFGRQIQILASWEDLGPLSAATQFFAEHITDWFDIGKHVFITSNHGGHNLFTETELMFKLWEARACAPVIPHQALRDLVVFGRGLERNHPFFPARTKRLEPARTSPADLLELARHCASWEDAYLDPRAKLKAIDLGSIGSLESAFAIIIGLPGGASERYRIKSECDGVDQKVSEFEKLKSSDPRRAQLGTLKNRQLKLTVMREQLAKLSEVKPSYTAEELPQQLVLRLEGWLHNLYQEQNGLIIRSKSAALVELATYYTYFQKCLIQDDTVSIADVFERQKKNHAMAMSVFQQWDTFLGLEPDAKMMKNFIGFLQKVKNIHEWATNVLNTASSDKDAADTMSPLIDGGDLALAEQQPALSDARMSVNLQVSLLPVVVSQLPFAGVDLATPPEAIVSHQETIRKKVADLPYGIEVRERTRRFRQQQAPTADATNSLIDLTRQIAFLPGGVIERSKLLAEIGRYKGQKSNGDLTPFLDKLRKFNGLNTYQENPTLNSATQQMLLDMESLTQHLWEQPDQRHRLPVLRAIADNYSYYQAMENQNSYSLVEFYRTMKDYHRRIIAQHMNLLWISAMGEQPSLEHCARYSPFYQSMHLLDEQCIQLQKLGMPDAGINAVYIQCLEVLITCTNKIAKDEITAEAMPEFLNTALTPVSEKLQSDPFFIRHKILVAAATILPDECDLPTLTTLEIEDKISPQQVAQQILLRLEKLPNDFDHWRYQELLGFVEGFQYFQRIMIVGGDQQSDTMGHRQDVEFAQRVLWQIVRTIPTAPTAENFAITLPFLNQALKFHKLMTLLAGSCDITPDEEASALRLTVQSARARMVAQMDNADFTLAVKMNWDLLDAEFLPNRSRAIQNKASPFYVTSAGFWNEQYQSLESQELDEIYFKISDFPNGTHDRKKLLSYIYEKFENMQAAPEPSSEQAISLSRDLEKFYKMQAYEAKPTAQSSPHQALLQFEKLLDECYALGMDSDIESYAQGMDSDAESDGQKIDFYTSIPKLKNSVQQFVSLTEMAAESSQLSSLANKTLYLWLLSLPEQPKLKNYSEFDFILERVNSLHEICLSIHRLNRGLKDALFQDYPRINALEQMVDKAYRQCESELDAYLADAHQEKDIHLFLAEDVHQLQYDFQLESARVNSYLYYFLNPGYRMFANPSVFVATQLINLCQLILSALQSLVCMCAASPPGGPSVGASEFVPLAVA